MKTNFHLSILSFIFILLTHPSYSFCQKKLGSSGTDVQFLQTQNNGRNNSDLDTSDNTPADIKKVLRAFAESHVNNDFKQLEKILSFDALLKYTQRGRVVSQHPSSVINAMRQNMGVKQNCSFVIKFLSGDDAMTLAEVSLVYKDFTIQNYLTLERKENQNWKITGINKFNIPGED